MSGELSKPQHLNTQIEMTSSNESDREQRDELDAPEDSKQSTKKSKRVGGTRRRTKTGCLTCRQRRVKCDEQKPTCRNCDKSRRQCAGYQPPTPRTPSNVPSNPFEHYQYMPPSLPTDNSGMFGFPMSQTEPYVDYFPPHAMSAHHLHHASNTEEWVLNGNYSNSGAGQWSPSQESWHSNMTNSQFYPREHLADVMPAHHIPQFVAYHGRHAPQTSGAEQIVAGSASSTNAHREIYARHTDLRKSTSRADGFGIDRATSSQSSVIDHSEIALLNSTLGRQHQSKTALASQTQSGVSLPQVSGTDGSDSSYSSYNTLARLRTSSNLILDERMAYLLSHFSNYLRPCISLWERPLRHDGTSTLAEKLPTAALTNKGLLHSMMAVSALHLAILHRTSEVIPLKHFVLASKKLPQLLESPATRFKLETLSQCLLLAFYSVILGDHAKWVLHLRGCSAFLMEHDFAGFYRTVRKIRRQKQKAQIPPTLRSDEDWELDETLIRNLTGLDIDYSNQAQIFLSKETDWNTLTESEIEDWKTKGDLLAWYLKMDVFQSALSGDRLLLPWQNWKFFAPRGKIGVEDKLYATMDHLWLVLGRLVDFGSKDRLRKQRKVALGGGQWQPEPGFLGPPPGQAHKHKEAGERSVAASTDAPNANEGRTRKPRAEHGSLKEKRKPPLFFGMMPPPPIPPSMLSSFHVMDAEMHKHHQTETRQPAESDIAVETKAALVEHQAIADALELWKDSIRGCFNPSPSDARVTDAAFSPEIRFSDPTHACLWAFYHFGRILLRRYHPYSPPAMMVSSVVNAHVTQRDAGMIGRIFCGLLTTQAELAGAGSINPTLVAALQEMTFPLMFAGVQYNSDVERKFIIESLVDIGNDSGWKSAFSVASALEKSWAAHGKYQPILKRLTPSEAMRYDVRVSSSGSLPSTPTQQHESRFDSHDRRFIDRFSDLRAYWAIGVLSTPDDIGKVFENLTLRSDP